jgi:hypothetical protein
VTPAAARCARTLARPVRAWGRLGFLLGFAGARPSADIGKSRGPMPSSWLLAETSGRLLEGLPSDPAAVEARLTASEAVQRVLMDEEMASLDTHYRMRTLGMATDFAMQMGALAAIAFAAFEGVATVPQLWVAFGAFAAWIGPGKILLARHLAKREAWLSRVPSPMPMPWGSA